MLENIKMFLIVYVWGKHVMLRNAVVKSIKYTSIQTENPLVFM